MDNKAPYAIFRTLEELISEYGWKQTRKLLHDSTVDDMQLHRGKALAAEEILTTLRNSLGYDHNTL